jgi:hypothetical protein
MISFTAETCPAPPSINRRSGQASVSRSGSSFSRRWNRRVSTSFIMPKSSPGVRSVAADVELAVLDFTNPSGPDTIIAPTALVPWMWELS